MTQDHDSRKDDELIARLKAAAGPESTAHDPYLDLPIAREERVEGDLSCPDAAARCNAPGRRPLAVQGYFGVPATEPIACELRAGHPGRHIAGFTRTRLLHRWNAFSWPDPSPGPEAA